VIVLVFVLWGFGLSSRHHPESRHHWSRKRLCATDEGVVEGNVHQLDDVTDGAHNEETNSNSLAESQELLLVGLSASSHELNTVSDELGGNLENLLNLVGHVG
jgi:hypothetical protein